MSTERVFLHCGVAVLYVGYKRSEMVCRSMSELSAVLEDKLWNAVLAWMFTVVLWGVMADSILSMEMLWAGFVGFVTCVVILPAFVYRDTTVMLPWEVVLLASLPIYGASSDVLVSYAPFLTSTVATYIAVATVALIITVELHVFTAVKMTHRFAVLFVVITTLAAAGAWAVLQWLSDMYLGTQFLSTNRVLMIGFLLATGSGIGSGIIFDAYFRRRRDRRLRSTYDEVIG